MRTYYIYMIKDEFADYFYGHESRFYQLFSGSRHSSGELLDIIQKQIAYITEPLPYLELHKLFTRNAQQNTILIQGNSYYAGKMKARKSAELTIEESYLLLHAKGGFDSETLFFEVLRKYEGHFFAVDFEHERYGWIKPVKERKYI